MRLINTTTLQLEDFSLKPKPKYAILSHTWEVSEEVSHQEMLYRSCSWKKGWVKIQNTCALALHNGLTYVWVDTCCIDKSSSAELSEAINSMFTWYQEAEECYALLSDLLPESHNQIEDCYWWTRGWTLQELIAPRHVVFFDANWVLVGSKEEHGHEIARHTGIPIEVLCHERQLSDISVAARMSWASKRSTTRKEDEAYCLLGLFDINMPLIYGEGTKAFLRLQEEIIKRSDDLSILAGDRDHNLLADSSRAFATCSGVKKILVRNYVSTEFSVTNTGLRFSGQIELFILNCELPGSSKQTRQVYALSIGIQGDHFMYDCLRLRKVGPTVFERHPDFSSTILCSPSVSDDYLTVSDICILNRRHDYRSYKMVENSSFGYAHAVHIAVADGFELKTVQPQSLWDVERRYITDRFDYDPPSYFDRVSMALILVKHELDPAHILVYWWVDKKLKVRGWSDGGNLKVSVLHMTSELQELERFLARNSSDRIFMEDFVNRFNIRTYSSSVKIELNGKLVTIQARLVQQDVINMYDLQVNITD